MSLPAGANRVTRAAASIACRGSGERRRSGVDPSLPTAGILLFRCRFPLLHGLLSRRALLSLGFLGVLLGLVATLVLDGRRLVVGSALLGLFGRRWLFRAG